MGTPHLHHRDEFEMQLPDSAVLLAAACIAVLVGYASYGIRRIINENRDAQQADNQGEAMLERLLALSVFVQKDPPFGTTVLRNGPRQHSNRRQPTISLVTHDDHPYHADREIVLRINQVGGVIEVVIPRAVAEQHIIRLFQNFTGERIHILVREGTNFRVV